MSSFWIFCIGSLATIFLCLGLHHLNSRSTYSPSDIQNPMASAGSAAACGRPGVAKSAICDPANILSKYSKDVSEGFINGIDKAEIAVLVVNKMSSNFVGHKSIESASEKFARTIHDTWGLGDKSTNNGVLVFLSVVDRAIYISTGTGAGRVLSSTVIDSIISHVKPDLRRKKYGSAIEKAVLEIGLVFEGKAIDPGKKSPTFLTAFLYILVFCCFKLVAGVVDFRDERSRIQRLQRGRQALGNFIREVRNEQDNRFGSTSCPICLEDFPENRAEGSAETSSEVSMNSNNRRPMELRCGHVFCSECLQSHLATPQGRTCPICRQPVHPDSPLPPPGARHPPGPQQQPHHEPHQQRGQRASSHDNDYHTGGSGSGTGNGAPSCSTSSSSSPSATSSSPGLETLSTDLRRQSSSGSFWRRRNLEYHYRLSRLRRLYPDVVTDESYRAMIRALERESVHELNSAAQARITVVQSILADGAKRAAAAKKGRSGSKRSKFGGGRSFGGGGGRF